MPSTAGGAAHKNENQRQQHAKYQPPLSFACLPFACVAVLVGGVWLRPTVRESRLVRSRVVGTRGRRRAAPVRIKIGRALALKPAGRRRWLYVTVWVIVVILVVRCRGGVGVPIVARLIPLSSCRSITSRCRRLNPGPLPGPNAGLPPAPCGPGRRSPADGGGQSFLFKSGHSDYLPFFAP